MILRLTLCLAMLCPLAVWGAERSFTFKCRTKVLRGRRVYYENRHHTYHFRMYVVSDRGGYKRERRRYQHSFIYAQPREHYSVVIYNPLPVTAAVNLSIDGINTISGRPCRPATGHKWLIRPRSYIKIRGWQVSSDNLRRFYFTSRKKSYAAWRSNQWGRDLTVKCGMISAAYFWSREDIERYFRRHPIVERSYYDDEDGPVALRKQRKRGFGTDSFEERSQAGTGQGYKSHNPVRSVHFDYDMGMYRPRQAVKILYDFPYRRRPWYHRDDDHYDDDDGFAPEQPYRDDNWGEYREDEWFDDDDWRKKR